MTIDAAPFAYDKYSDVLDGGGIVYDSYEWCGADPAACERPQVLISTPFLTFQDGALVGFSLYSEPGVGLPIAPLISGEGTSSTIERTRVAEGKGVSIRGDPRWDRLINKKK